MTGWIPRQSPRIAHDRLDPTPIAPDRSWPVGYHANRPG